MTGITFQPLIPPWLLFLSMGTLLLVTSRRGRIFVSRTGALNVLLLGALLLIGLGPGRTTAVGRPPAVVFLLDSSHSMALQGRFDQARKLIVSTLSNPALSIDGEMDARVHTFDSRVVERTAKSLAQLEPEGKTTRLAAALEQTLNAFDDLLAVVLLSDGAHLGAGDPIAQGRRAANRRTPIHCVLLGHEERTPDGLLMAEVPGRIAGRPGTRVAIPVSVAVSGRAPPRAIVEITDRTGARLDRAEVSLTDGTGRTTFTLTLPATSTAAWTFSLLPVGGEQSLENNRVTVLADAQGPRAEIVLLEGKPLWEGSHLVRACALDPRIDLRAARLLTPDRPVLVGLDEADYPLGAEALQSASAVVLGQDWTRLCREAGEEAVAGRPIVLLAGAALPRTRGASITWGEPVRGTVRLTPAGRRYPALRLLDGRKATGRDLSLERATVLATLEASAGTVVPVVTLADDRRTLAFGLTGALRVGRDDAAFFTRFLTETLNLLPPDEVRTDRRNYDLGERVFFSGKPGLRFRVLGPQAQQFDVTLDGEGDASVSPRRPGVYDILLAGKSTPAFSVQDRRIERLVRQPNHALLKTLSQAAGGSVLPPDEGRLATLVNRLHTQSGQRMAQSFTPIWDRPWFFAVLAGLILVVWLTGGRRREST